MSKQSLKPEALYTKTKLEQIGFDSTADIEKIDSDVIGQSRALDAIEFGVGMHRDNYNIYVAGSTGLGKHTVVQRILEQYATENKPPSDWCYIDNYEEFYKPLALELPAGVGVQLRADMKQLVDDLLIAIPATYESDEYRSQALEIEEVAEERKEKTFKALTDKAEEQQITLLNTPTGYTLVPLSGDVPMPPDEFNKLSEEMQNKLQSKIDALKKDLKEVILKIPEWQKETMEQFKKLNTGFAKTTVEQSLRALSIKYADTPAAAKHLERVREDIIHNMHYFLTETTESKILAGQTTSPPIELQRYAINILVNNSDLKGSPIIYENNPTYDNLIGRIEHVAQEGALVTDFTLIKPGALHRANGGFLVLDMDKLLMNQFAWQALKRVLYARKIRMESLERMLSLASTISLEPEPIPLDIKVILIGDRYLYHLLKMYDPEFSQLFKVTADFSESFDRDSEAVAQIAQLVASIANKEEIRPINREGVARIIENCARETEDAEKLSLHNAMLRDLILESDYRAGKEKATQITAEHVQQAIEARLYRSNQIHELVQEQILRDIVLIDTQSVCSGQVNGLSVYKLGDYSFGQPSRITATARLGNGNVLDIERETKLGGPIHSKGVIILSSCLANRYAQNRPLSLNASLVFEQSYGGIDGDSASIAEYCALISAITDIPIKQGYAVTGSINQHGFTQAIGGVNQKIEGFFSICDARGLTGDQGVIIPVANAKHLMLHQDVVEAVAYNQFQVHTVETVDDALELLMGMPVGKANGQGKYPKDTINYRVMKRLDELHQLHRQHSSSEKHGEVDNDE